MVKGRRIRKDFKSYVVNSRDNLWIAKRSMPSKFESGAYLIILQRI